jgi:hypothetical protein
MSLSHAEISRICDDAIKEAVLNESKITHNHLIKLVEERLAVYSREAK